jgi:hypothetical protein
MDDEQAEIERVEALSTENQYRNRIIGMGMAEVDQLLANPKNAAIHSHAQERALDTILSRVGWVSGIIVNRRTNFIADGHGRVLVAMDKGEATVPVQWVDITDEEEDIILAAMNATGRMSGTDQEKARQLLQDIRARETEEVQALVADIAQRQSIKLEGLAQLPTELPQSAARPMQERPNIVDRPPSEPDEDEEDGDEDDDDAPFEMPTMLPLRGLQSITIDLRQHPDAVDTLRTLREALALPNYDAALLSLLKRMKGRVAIVLGDLGY